MFQSLRQGSTIYVLSMEGRPKVYVAQVTEHTSPVAKLNSTPPPFGQPMPMTVDIKATDGKTNFQFDKLDAGAVVFEYVGNNIVSTTMEALAVEWDKRLSASKRHVDMTPYHQGVIDAAPEINAIINPQFAREQERDREIGNLKTEMSGMKGTLSNIEAMLSNVLNGGNNSSSRKKE